MHGCTRTTIEANGVSWLLILKHLVLFLNLKEGFWCIKGPLRERIKAEPWFGSQNNSQFFSEMPILYSHPSQPATSHPWQTRALCDFSLLKLLLFLMTPDRVLTCPAETSSFCDIFRLFQSELIISLALARPHVRNLHVIMYLFEASRPIKNQFC